MSGTSGSYSYFLPEALSPSDIHPSSRKPIKNQFMMFNSWICSAHGNNISPLPDNSSLPSSLLAHYKHYKMLVTFPPSVDICVCADPLSPPPDWCISKGFSLVIFHVFSKHLSPMSGLCGGWSWAPSHVMRGRGSIGAGAGVRGGRSRDIMIRQTLAPAQLSDDPRPGILCSAPNFDTAAKFCLNLEPDASDTGSSLDCSPNILWSHRLSEEDIWDNNRFKDHASEVFCLSVWWLGECSPKTNLHSG